MLITSLMTGLIAGVLLANQIPINSHLQKSVVSPFKTVIIAYSVGVVFLIFLLSIAGQNLFVSSTVFSHQPLWLWTGGLLGAVYQTTNVVVFRKIGAVQTVVLPVFGQVLVSTAIDTFGWFNSPVVKLTGIHLIGLFILIAGLIIAVGVSKQSEFEKTTVAKILDGDGTLTAERRGVWQVTLYRIASIFGGVSFGLQQAVNGKMGAAVGSPLQASLISYGISAIGLIVVVLIVERSVLPSKETFKLSKISPWTFLGGVFGSLAVVANISNVPHIGAGRNILLVIIGQFVSALVIQYFGLWSSIKKRVMVPQYMGVAMMALGVFFLKF
ncbi:DMT family transporter [Periweissella cryptocerci]|uniref:DMT family transporter n=1 Tax=Periweissella cryptocerci TaxID=2506420 RepID=A0A4P6YTS2_9LACO|nr:DMT family transporter [Periweissella cryptocerci]QBO36100.1 DMT family transporter [Periweissella cryptocerci]